MAAEAGAVRSVTPEEGRPTLVAVAPDDLVTLETVVDPEQAERFLRLYLRAFGPLRSRAVARQVLHREEFLAQMADLRVWKLVVRDRVGRPVALSTLTRDLTTVPWISPEYFATRFPEQTARNAVYYWGFTLTSPQHRQDKGLLLAMMRAVGDLVAADHGVCGYDICAYNDARPGFGAQIETIARRLTDVTFEVLDTQTYYCATLP